VLGFYPIAGEPIAGLPVFIIDVILIVKACDTYVPGTLLYEEYVPGKQEYGEYVPKGTILDVHQGEC
jgi:hypothetical protein